MSIKPSRSNSLSTTAGDVGAHSYAGPAQGRLEWRKNLITRSLDKAIVPTDDASAVMDRAEAWLESLEQTFQMHPTGLSRRGKSQ